MPRRGNSPVAKLLEDGTLMLFGVIGDEYDGLDSATIVEELRSLGDADVIQVLINSPGGLVDQGLAIYHELATNPARVEVEISGVAASMGSAIAMAGDFVRIAENGLIMIHDPWNVAIGDADELRKAAEILDKFGDSLVGIYQRKTGLDEDEIRELMAEETWLDAHEALEKGFVDEIMEPLEAAAFANIDVSELESVPARLTALIRQGRRAVAKANTTTGDGDMPKPKTDDKSTQPAGDGGTPPSAGGDEGAAAPSAGAGQEALAEERQRAMAIRSVARQYEGRIPDDLGDQYIASGRSEVEFRVRISEILANASATQNPRPGPSGVFVRADQHDRWMKGMTDWILVKAGVARMIEKHTEEKLEPGEYRGYRMVDIAREALEMRGHSTRGLDPREIVRQALIGGTRAELAGLGSRSDFPVLLENVLHKMLLAAYEIAVDRWREVAAVGSVMDFRDHPRLRLGSMPRLDELQESGEFKHLHFPDAEKELIRASTYGNIVGLTRQAILNDDVNGFARLVTMLGRAAARSIEIDLFALFELNGGLGPTMRDGDPLFDANHNNISTPTGLPSVSTLEQARVDMAQQTDPDGNDFLDLRPAVWVGAIGHGAAVRTAISAEFDFDSETSGNTGKFMKPNIVRDLLDTVVDTARLSGDRWYVLADPQIAPVFEVVFLEGQETPMIEVEEGFKYDGVQWRVRHDYGVGATDFRGAITNAGS